MPKQGMDQHLLLHERWPGDCCLCGHEATIADLRRQLAEAQEQIRVIEHARKLEVRKSLAAEAALRGFYVLMRP